jgi:hypothetical protein
MTAVLNAANEAAKEIFREDFGLGFLDIPKLIEGAMEAHKADLKIDDAMLDEILTCDTWAREYVTKCSAPDDSERWQGVGGIEKKEVDSNHTNYYNMTYLLALRTQFTMVVTYVTLPGAATT